LGQVVDRDFRESVKANFDLESRLYAPDRRNRELSDRDYEERGRAELNSENKLKGQSRSIRELSQRDYEDSARRRSTRMERNMPG